jgi:hypothetical protein
MPISLQRRFPRMAKASGTHAASLVEEGWKLEQIRKDSPDAQFVPVYAARIKAVEEIKKRLGNDQGVHEE